VLSLHRAPQQGSFSYEVPLFRGYVALPATTPPYFITLKPLYMDAIQLQKYAATIHVRREDVVHACTSHLLSILSTGAPDRPEALYEGSRHWRYVVGHVFMTSRLHHDVSESM
jgi:hypothetical protein